MSLQTMMFIAFILAFSLAMYKLYQFFPTSPLEDDDTNQESIDELTDLMLKVIERDCSGDLDRKKLAKLMIEHEEFDNKHFWRFNENKLKNLLERYYLNNQEVNSITDIYNQRRGDV